MLKNDDFAMFFKIISAVPGTGTADAISLKAYAFAALSFFASWDFFLAAQFLCIRPFAQA